MGTDATVGRSDANDRYVQSPEQFGRPTTLWAGLHASSVAVVESLRSDRIASAFSA